jgi:hypothetical protein
MAVPEELVTIRTYDSPELADADHQALVDAGIAAYTSGSYHRHSAQTELRVPASQVEAALDILPPELPTLADLTAPTVQCVVCRSTAVRTDSPAMKYVLLAGGAAAAWVVFYRGAFDAGIMLLLATVTLAAGVRARFHFRKCDACGHEWHRADQLRD